MLDAQLANSLGMVHEMTGNVDEARRQFERSVALAERSPNPRADLAASLSNLGTLLLRRGRFAEAEPLLRRSLELRIARVGPDHPAIGQHHMNLGSLYARQRRWDEARIHHEQSYAIAQATLRPDHTTIAAILQNLATVWEPRDLDRAEHYYRASLAIWRTNHGDDHPDVAEVRVALGRIDLARERPGQCLQACAAADLTFTRSQPRSAPAMLALSCIGDAWLALRRPDAALEPLERAAALASALQVSGYDSALIEHSLARALWASNRDRPRAVLLAEAALDRAHSDDQPAIRADLARWREPRPRR